MKADAIQLQTVRSWRWTRPLLLLLFGMTQFVRADEVKDVQQAIVANRLSIKQWHIAARISIHPNDGSHGKDVDSAVGFVSYCDGQRQRRDAFYRYLPHERFPGLSTDEYVTYRIWSDDHVISWSDQEFPGKTTVIKVADRPLSADASGHDALLFDARWLGWGADLDFPPQEVFSNPDFTQWRVTDEEWRGILCKKLTFSRQDSSDQGAYWVAPPMGHSVLRAVLEYGEGDTSGVLAGEFEVEEWRGSGIWFPKRAVRESQDAAGSVLRREEMTIDVFSINESLDPGLFTLEAISPPPNTRVFYNPTRGSDLTKWIWNGSEVVALDRETTRTVSQGPNATGRYRWLLLANAFILTIICTVCLWWAFRRRSAT